MRARRRMAGDQRQRLLGALQRLDLALLINRQDHGVVGWIDIQPDYVAHLVDEGGIARDLETLDQMRLQPMLVPDLLDAGLAQANRPGQAARAPVRGVGRHRALRALHHRAHLVRPDRRRPAGAWPVAQQAIHAFGDEPVPPPPHRALGFADLTHDRHRANTRGRQQHNPRPPHVFLLHTRGGDEGFQTRPRLRRHSDLRFLFHPNYMGTPSTNWNLTSRPGH